MTSDTQQRSDMEQAWVLRLNQPGEITEARATFPVARDATLALVAVRGDTAEVLAAQQADTARELAVSASYGSIRQETSALSDLLAGFGAEQSAPGLFLVLFPGRADSAALEEITLLRRGHVHPGEIDLGARLEVQGALLVTPPISREGLPGKSWPLSTLGPDPYYNYSQGGYGLTAETSTALVGIVARDTREASLSELPWRTVSARRGARAIVAVPQDSGLKVGPYVFGLLPLGALAGETGPIHINYQFDGELYYDTLEPSAPASLLKCTLHRWSRARRTAEPDGEASLRIDWIDGRPKLSLFEGGRR